MNDHTPNTGNLAEESLLTCAIADERLRLGRLLQTALTCAFDEYPEAKKRAIECNKRLLQFEKFRDVLSQ